MCTSLQHWGFYLAMEFVVYAFGIGLLWHAKKQGARWVSTMVCGGIFGLFIERYVVTSVKPGDIYYRYSECFQIEFWSGTGVVPLWIAVGWACLLYASTWTADRLRLHWLWGSLSAAILAVNIDLSLDPIANYLGFWTWIYPDPTEKPINYYDVSFDNFIGWFTIVSNYALGMRGGFAIFEKIVARIRSKNAARRLSAIGEYAIPLLAAGFATICVILVFLALPFVYQFIHDWLLFIALFFGSFALTCYAAVRSRRDGEIAWLMLGMPIFFHGFAIVTLLFTDAHTSMPTLLVALPEHLLAGLFGYAWPSTDKLSRFLLSLIPGTPREPGSTLAAPSSPVHDLDPVT